MTLGLTLSSDDRTYARFVCCLSSCSAKGVRALGILLLTAAGARSNWGECMLRVSGVSQRCQGFGRLPLLPFAGARFKWVQCILGVQGLVRGVRLLGNSFCIPLQVPRVSRGMCQRSEGSETFSLLTFAGARPKWGECPAAPLAASRHTRASGPLLPALQE